MKYHRQYVCLLLQVISFVTNCLAENLIFNINFKKPIAITDHAFLSFTLDPTTLQYNDFIKNIEKSTNLARSLAPAYIRLGGPQSNFYNFEQVHSYEIDTDPNDIHFGTQWTLIYQWAKNAGLDVIACINPHYIDKKLKTDSRDPRNIAELLSFSDRMGYNISWQLGYECQTRCDLSGGELGQYVTDLHEILKTFPRYSNSLITGPDIIACKTAHQQKYLQDYLHSANSALSAITWHPNLDSVSLSSNISIYYDNMIAEKDELFKIISRVGKKPLWIAESKSQENKYQYLEALIWMKRLGDTAKLGIQVVMRQLTNLTQATPAYWVSLLYKTLVDREVLEINLQSNNESYVHFYSQCTKPSALYSKGAITIFGINLRPKTVTASLKDFKIKILHKYILLPKFETGNKMFSKKVLLNNKPLNLINDKNLPDIHPEIIINPDGLELELPSGGIGFWIVPNAMVKACTCSEEETIENNVVKKLSKRHENNIQQHNQEEEEDINQSNVIGDDIKENINQSNLKNGIFDKQDSKKQKNIENIKNESQQKVWSSKLLAKIKRILQKKLQKVDKNESSQKSFDLGKEQENSFEEIEEQQNLDNKNFKETEIDDKFESIQDLLKKYKSILLEKKTEMEIEDIQHLKPEIENIDNVVTLISKIDAFILYKIISNQPAMSEIKDKIKNEEELVIRINKRLKEYLSKLENSAEIKANMIKKIEKDFNKLYNLLKYNDSTKTNKNSQVFNHGDLMEQKRFKKHLDRKSENLKKNRILEKRSQINNLKDHAIKQKIKQKNDVNLLDNLKRNNNLLQRDPVKRFFRSDAFKNADRIDNQHLVQEYNRIKNDNIYKKHSKIGDMKKYQNLIQEPERMKRDITKKFETVETDLRRDSASRKNSRIDDLENYVNKRKMKNDVRRGLLLPFNPTDSDENNFYGFFRRDPVEGFPEGDIFVTVRDSLEQNGEDYNYVEDEDDSNDGSKKKNTQYSSKSTSGHAKDNIRIKEVKDDHCDYMPNEFFENIKLSDIKPKENSKNYDDLWEAEFLSEIHNDNNNNNNDNNKKNEIAVTKVIKKQPDEEKKKHTKETGIQQLVHRYDDYEKQKYNRDALQSVSRYPSASFDQLLKVPNSNINYHESNAESKTAKLKMKLESKISNSLYPEAFEASTVKFNYNGNYQISSMNYDTLNEENSLDKNIDSNDSINEKTIQYSRPSIYAEHSIHDKRNKRNNLEEFRKIFAKEMIKEDEKNTRDCHCRVIRASDSSKKFHYHRMKRNLSVPIARVTNTSSGNRNVNTNVSQFQKDPTTEEKYQEIMAGEILPSISNNEPDYEENDITTKSVITKLNTLDHESSNTTQAIDVTSILELDNVSEQYHNAKKSTTDLLSVDSDSNNNNKSIKYFTNQTFFRTQPSDVQSENETKTHTYDSSQIISKISSENKNTREKLTISVSNNTQETPYEKVQKFTKKKEKASSIYPTITEDQNNKEGHNNDYKIGLKSINSRKKTKEIVEQETTEAILLNRARSTAIDSTKSNESKTKSKLRNTEDNQNSESEFWMQLGKDANTRRLKTILQNLPQTSLEGLTRHEKRLTRRSEQIDKLKEKWYVKQEKLLQYQDKLTKIADKRKRNLKKREAWEDLRGSDDFHRLIDQKFIGILLDDDVSYEADDLTYEDDNGSCLILIKLIPKQYKNITDQIYLLAKAKKVHYPEHNKYYQVPQNLIEDNEELAETSKSSECKYNQYYEYIPNIIKNKEKAFKFLNHENNQDSSRIIEDERESTEATSKPSDHKVFIIDPSTYYGGESILYKDYLKFSKHHSKIKNSQIRNSTIPRWILKDIHRVLTKLKFSEAQHQVSKSQEYIEEMPVKDYYDQECTNSFHVLDKQKQYNSSKELATQVWQNSFDRRDVNQASNKKANKLNDMHKNLKDNLNSTFAINEKTELRSFETEKNIENKEFNSSDNRKKDIMNSETIEDVVKIKKFENDMIKHEKINKSNNSNDKAENNLNITMSNNNKTAEHVEKIIKNNPKGKELGKKNSRFRRYLGKQGYKCIDRLAPFFPLSKNTENKLNNMRVYLKEESIKKIFDTEPMTIYLLTKPSKLSNVGLFQRSKNYFVPLKRINQQNQKEYDLNYITLTPIEIKNIFEILDVKNNDDSLESSEIPQWDDQYVLEEILGSMTKHLNDKISEEFEYKNLLNLQNENNEIIIDEESYLCENKQDDTAKDNGIESERDKQYKITNDEVNKFLKLKHQIGSNKRGIFLFPWRNMKIRQRRQIKSEINEDIAEVKREDIRQLQQSNKSILAEDHENKRNKRYYLNNNIDKKEEENMIETKRVNYLQSQIKNRDNLLEDFIIARKKNNLYNNETSSIKNEEKNKIIPLNNISKSDKRILQKEMPKLQNIESVEELVNDFKENVNDILVNENEHYTNRTSGITDNVFYTAIMNIKDLFAFFSKISRIFMHDF